MFVVENIKEFDKSLKKHIAIESYLGNTWGVNAVLKEEHGMIPNLLKYVAVFKNKILKLKGNYRGKENVITAKFNIDDFLKINPFFDLIDLSVTISLNNDADSDKGGGIYRAGKSGFVKTNDGRQKYLITIDIFDVKSISGDAAVDYACRIFAHELTHAYDDFQRHIHKKKTIADFAQENNLDKINLEAMNGKVLANFLYLTNPSEINAMVGELPLSIFNSCVGDYSIKSVFNAIKKTRMYRSYQNLLRWMNQLLFINPINNEIANTNKNLLLSEFNRLTKYNYKTFNQMTTFLYKRFKKYEKKLLTQGPKIAYDIYNGRTDMIDHLQHERK